MPQNPQHVILFHHLRRFLEEAAKEGIDAIPLKGAHLLTSVYPEDEDRGKLSDVDLMVRPEQLERACDAAAKLGFEERTDTHRGPHSHERALALQVDLDSMVFEIHSQLFHPKRLPIDHDGIWTRSTESTLDGAPCRRLAVEDCFAHVALHGVIHRLMQIERTARDLELLLIRGDVDPALLLERAREWRITRAVWIFLDLIERTSADLRPGELSEPFAPPRRVQRALRAFVPDRRKTRLTRLHHRLQASVLWPLAFDSRRQLARYLAGHPSLPFS